MSDTRAVTAPTSLPWLTLVDNGDGTGTLSGTPTGNDSGLVELRVADAGGLTAFQRFTIDVQSVAGTNRPPAFTSVPVTNSTAGTACTYIAAASDPDGDALTFAAPQLPAWLAFSPAAGGGTLSGTPSLLDIGIAAITLTVSDPSGLTATQSFSITVAGSPPRPGNRAPTAFDLAIEVARDVPRNFQLSGADPDGDPLIYLVVSNPANGTLSGVAPDLVYTPAAGFSGSDSFRYAVSDGQAISASATVSIVVAQPPPFAAVFGVYEGVILAATNLAAESSGFLKLKLKPRKRIRGKLELDGKRFRLRAKAPEAEAFSGPFRDRSGRETLLTLRVTGTNLIQGTLSNSAFVTSVDLHRRAYKRRDNPWPFAKRYTAAIFAPTNSPADTGFGIATITVNKGGLARINGRLSDGTRFNRRTGVSDRGNWPVYRSLYRQRRGAVVASLVFRRGPDSELDGRVAWFRPDGPALTADTTLIGQAIDPDEPPLEEGPATLIFSGAGLPPLTNSIDIDNRGRLSLSDGPRSDLKAKLTPSGLIRGTFRHPAQPKKLRFHAVALPGDTNAAGHFQGPSGNGPVILVP